jgi:hypothetical protein
MHVSIQTFVLNHSIYLKNRIKIRWIVSKILAYIGTDSGKRLCFILWCEYGYDHRLRINRPTMRGKENLRSDGHCQSEKEMEDVMT